MRRLGATPVPPAFGPGGCAAVHASFIVRDPPAADDVDAPLPSVRLEYVDENGEIAGERIIERADFEAASQRFAALTATLERTGREVDPGWAGRLSAVVICEDGTRATADWSGEDWHWVTWSLPGESTVRQ